MMVMVMIRVDETFEHKNLVFMTSDVADYD